MKVLRLLLPSLALAALTITGCVLTSAQILAHFDLPNPFTIDSSGSAFELVAVDLNTIGDYKDNKDKLKGLVDCAILGTFTNVSGPAGSLVVYITAGTTNYTTVGQITSSATKLWGPASIGASGTSADKVKIKWDDSAALFNSAGKAILLNETKGDGAFTLYAIGTSATYQIRVTGGLLVLVLDAGL